MQLNKIFLFHCFPETSGSLEILESTPMDSLPNLWKFHCCLGEKNVWCVCFVSFQSWGKIINSQTNVIKDSRGQRWLKVREWACIGVKQHREIYNVRNECISNTVLSSVQTLPGYPWLLSFERNLNRPFFSS